jgi:DNA adenine methylase
MKAIKSPLRYPGGKAKAIDKIKPYFPMTFTEYREPFVGGGSVFIHLKQQHPNSKYWINDLNHELICFWQQVQSNLDGLVKAIWQIKAETVEGRSLFARLVSIEDLSQLTEFERAVRFFVLNRITFSGTVDSGGYSQKAFERRFTNSAIERLSKLAGLLENTLITHLDYSKTLYEPGNDVFIFLDPPYLAATQSRLYGKRGHLHTSFKHQEFAAHLKNCCHRWLITYDDSPEIRENFAFAYVYEWEMQYGMNNYMQEKAAKGKELIITNYLVDLKQSHQQLAIF